MESITDKLVHSTVRIDCLDALGNASSGTGFFYNLAQDAKLMFPAIVTNKHVVGGAARGFIQLTFCDAAGNPDYGNHERVELLDFAARWMEHPDPDVDLAICMFAPIREELAKLGKIPCWAAVGESFIPTVEQLNNLNAVEDILMFGYPNGLWDAHNNLPIVRRGITATPVFRDYEGRQEFLIDAACFPGSSGSPVYIVNQGIIHQKNTAALTAGSRAILLGVLYAGPQFTATGEIVIQTVPTNVQAVPVIKTMMNLGVYIRSSRLSEFKDVLRKKGIVLPGDKAAAT